MNQNETLDFSNVDSLEGGGTYLNPGIYYVKPTAVELVEGAEGKSSAIKVTFTAVNDEYAGQSIAEKFFLTQKALPRLQYLHEQYFGAKLENKAITFQKLADYLSAKMLAKPKTILLSVGASEGTNGKIYSQLPYADFVIDEVANPNVVEGAYEEGSAEYNKAVKKNRTPATNSSAAVLSHAGVDNGKMPWEQD